MKRVADYIFDHLVQTGTTHVFLVTGGGAMFLNDALGRCKSLQYVCCHHEQSCAMAAEAYARVSGKIGVLSVTTGPGGINALNGVFGAHVDSIPMLIISGQVKRETCLASYNLPELRQLGDQEVDIIRMVKGITKYAVLVDDPKTIRFHLEKALHLAMTGRQGPVWLDIPVDVQSAMIDPEQLTGYVPTADSSTLDRTALESACRDVLDRISNAKRPVIMAGTGIHLAKANEIFEVVTKKLGIPVTTAWTAHDLIETDSPLFCGRPSSLGDRPGNFTVQNSDVLLVLGSRLNVRQISYNWKDFARHAFKIQVDIDAPELDKPTVKPDLGICSDLKVFLEELNRQIDARAIDAKKHATWLAWCKERVARYPVVTEKQRNAGTPINPYHFIDVLIRRLKSDDVIACGDGTACVVPFQVAHIKKGMRMFCNSGDASMGYDIPSAIGSAFAAPGRRIICLAGDGSGHFNIQELQTIVHHNLPIKVFVLNNGGYLSIRLTQTGFFKGNYIGEGARSGVSFPDFVKVAQAYGLPAIKIEAADFGKQLDEFLKQEGPALCEVMLDPNQGFEPKLSSRQLPDGKIVTASLEDMAPFLDREELAKNMLVPLA
ncbi:MAG: acetolactate synthase [Verrucomicrobiales bacterium]|nr:acetolactate synthase [Verrucomicrobiales bacterium]